MIAGINSRKVTLHRVAFLFPLAYSSLPSIPFHAGTFFIQTGLTNCPRILLTWHLAIESSP